MPNMLSIVTILLTKDLNAKSLEHDSIFLIDNLIDLRRDDNNFISLLKSSTPEHDGLSYAFTAYNKKLSLLSFSKFMLLLLIAALQAALHLSSFVLEFK